MSGCSEITCSYPEEQQQHWSCTTRISQVCWYFPQKSGSEITCTVSDDRRRRETKRDWMVQMCLHLHLHTISWNSL